jgi:hypothetical protein
MNHEDPVRAALQALADHDRHRESSLPAPRLRALQPKSPSIRTRWKTGTVYAVAALATAATVLVLMNPGGEAVRAPVPPQATPVEIETTAVEAPERTVDREVPDNGDGRAKAILASVQTEPETEFTTEFFPLTDSRLPFEHGRLLRVMVPAATMQRVGLPVRPERWADRVTADVLVGDEGVPRAIRFVSFQQ